MPASDVLQPRSSSVPIGMLRISKEGEQDRVIYPVHAEGWAAIGWKVHPPEPDPEEDEGGLGLEGQPPPAPPGLPGVPGGGEGPFLQPLELVDLTKAQIVEAVEERYGVRLDMTLTRAQMLAEARALAEGHAAGGAGTGEEGGDAGAGTGDAGAEAEAGADLEAAGDVVVPPLI